MGFSFRKSINLGFIKLNLTKSGVGISTGVKGFRISANKKGVNLHTGRKGFYYRKHFGYNKPDEDFILSEEFLEKNLNKEELEERAKEYEKAIKLCKYKLCKSCGLKIKKTDEYCPFCGDLNCLNVSIIDKIIIILLIYTVFWSSIKQTTISFLMLALMFFVIVPIKIVSILYKNFANYKRIRKQNNLKLFKKVNYLTEGYDFKKNEVTNE